MHKYIKYSIFFLFLIVLVAPAIQTFKVVEIAPLNGSFELAKMPQFTKEGWLSGTFQEQVNKSVEDHVGFRNWFIRFRNQVDFLLFKKIHAVAVVVGKDDVLFQSTYIEAYYGLDFSGKDVIKRKLDKFQLVQDELKKKGIYLILMFAPSKASFYPEYIPENWKPIVKNPSNYAICIEELQHRSINYIDMSRYLQNIKDTSRYPLFPKCGTHWSGYAVTLVADTFAKYIENLTKLDLVDFQSKPGVVTNKDFRFTDNDIVRGLNLMRDIRQWPVYYPNVQFYNDSTKDMPDVLSIGDSFNQSFWGFYPYYSNLFGSNSQFWYYNRIVSWPDSIEWKYISTESLDYKKEIEQRKIILIVTTEATLNDFGFSFIDEAYNIYCPEIQYDKRIEEYKNRVMSDSSMFKALKEKAFVRNISIDHMAFMDSKWIINDTERRRDMYLHQIYSDTLLYNAVRKSSLKYNVDSDVVIGKYAEFLMK